MAEPVGRVPVAGTRFRHVRSGAGALTAGREGDGRFHRPGCTVVYLADSEATAWAEWYRWLAEWGQPPAEHLPRELHRITVDLDDVVDLSSTAAREAAGVPTRMRPAKSQWTSFQERADRWRGEGAEGVLYSSAARTRSLCLCVFESGLEHLQIVGEPIHVIAPPPPPRGLRT
ncbi:MAG: RES family NAD+ phosphorylase [Solirubrobacteraceae bacterium]